MAANGKVVKYGDPVDEIRRDPPEHVIRDEVDERAKAKERLVKMLERDQGPQRE